MRNYILLITVKQLRTPCRQKDNLYILTTITGDPISYGDRIIYIKMELIKLKIKGRTIYIMFNILPLGRDKTVLRMLWL